MHVAPGISECLPSMKHEPLGPIPDKHLWMAVAASRNSIRSLELFCIWVGVAGARQKGFAPSGYHRTTFDLHGKRRTSVLLEAVMQNERTVLRER